MSANTYKAGSWNNICPRCGQKYKAEDMQKEWTKQLVCKNCYDPRHPVTMPIPNIKEMQPVLDARPRPRPKTVTITNPSSMGVWGQYYVTRTGIKTSLNWEAWDNYWGGLDSVSYTPENFPLI